MGRRRKAREAALQLLYQLDVTGEDDPGTQAKDFWARHPVDEATRAYAEALVRGAKQHQAKSDEIIRQYVEHWDPERLAVVDRNILRLAIYEMLWGADVPPKVVIDEAIELAKKFGTGESGRFVNGVLDRVLKELRPGA